MQHQLGCWLLWYQVYFSGSLKCQLKACIYYLIPVQLHPKAMLESRSPTAKLTKLGVEHPPVFVLIQNFPFLWIFSVFNESRKWMWPKKAKMLFSGWKTESIVFALKRAFSCIRIFCTNFKEKTGYSVGAQILGFCFAQPQDLIHPNHRIVWFVGVSTLAEVAPQTSRIQFMLNDIDFGITNLSCRRTTSGHSAGGGWPRIAESARWPWRRRRSAMGRWRPQGRRLWKQRDLGKGRLRWTFHLEWKHSSRKC